MRDVETLLRGCFHVQGWDIRHPDEGSSGKEAYVARQGNRAVFITFDVPIPALRRLSALGVTPPVLHAGTSLGRTYCIQEYVPARHPDAAWFPDHAQDVAMLVRTYHMDVDLQRLAAESAPGDGESAPQWEVRQLEERASQLLKMSGTTGVAFAEFVRQAEFMPPVPLVPTHPDPNLKNFLVHQGRIYLVDWDAVVFSHPGRDLGPLLWWYFPRASWDGFLAAYGTRFDPEAVYWWSARRSLAVAIWLFERDERAAAARFVEDFVAATSGRENPRRCYRRR